MVRKSYIVSGRDLRIRPRNRPGEPEYPTEPGHPDNPEMPGPYPPETGYPPEDGEGDYEDAIHPPPPHVGHAPGLYIGPTKGNPVIPVPPEPEEGEHLKLPPGAVWPKAYGRVSGHYVALAYIPEHGWRYIVIDPDAWPSWPKKDDEENGEGQHDAAHPDKPTVPEPATRRPGAPTPGRGS